MNERILNVTGMTCADCAHHVEKALQAVPELTEVTVSYPKREVRIRSTQSLSLARLNEAMSRLPPHLKAPLMLTAIEGRSQAETAGMLGVSIKTVETRVARARRKLSEALDDTPAVRAALE